MKNSQRAKYIVCACMLLVGIFSAVILYKSLRPSTGVPYEVLTGTEAEEYMEFEEGFLLVDVQSTEHYEEDHMEGAVNIPYDSLVEHAATLFPDQDQMIYIYGEDEETSRKAAMKLCQCGYTNVSCVLRGSGEAEKTEQMGSSEGETDGPET